MIDPMRRFDKAIEILDQRRLPETLSYITCTRAITVVEAIQSLAVRGAPAIAVAGLYGIWLESLALQGERRYVESLEVAKDQIKHARPTAVNLSWAVDRVWTRRPLDPHALPSYLRAAADHLYEEERARNQCMADLGSRLLGPGSRVLTHCNTGSLATIGVGTALGVIREAHAQGNISHVWVDETRPLLQGARLTAWELLQDGIPATLITDNMGASLMAREQVDAVLVGADRIAGNGDTANKIGTYGLAIWAHFHQIPFYVVAPLSTIDRSLAHGSGIPVEERNPEEVRTVRGQAIAPQGMGAYNPAFDVTPAALITALVTDAGVVKGPYETAIAELFKQNREDDEHA